MSIKPFIFIGVGGTGGKTLGVIRQTLKDVLSRIGWQGEWPRGWQFLHIDVPATPDALADNLPYALPRTQYLGLTDARSTYVNFDQSVSQSLRRAVPDQAMRYQSWDSWRPVPPTSVKVNIVNGAGQYRAIGRACVAHSLSAVDRAVAKAISLALDPGAAGELQQIQQALGEVDGGAADNKPVVFVIGSVAGGSGSGMFMDVCEVLRGQGHDEIIALLFTPEVFERPNGELDPGVAPNTFMALNELVNAMWTTSPADAPASRDRLFSRAGVGVPVGHCGPSTVFLVGRSNGRVTFRNTWDVYKIVGRSLAELALNEMLTQQVIAYDLANAQAVAAGAMDGLELSSPGGVPDIAAFRSLGFSRLSVGRDFFERYAADRIVRAAAEKLLDGHLQRRQPGDNSSDEELLNKVVEEAWPAFLRDSEIDEFEANNAITDVLNSENDPAVLASSRALQEKVRSAIGNSAVRGRVKALDAREQVIREIGLERKSAESILSKGYAATGRNARTFQNAIQGTLATVVTSAIAAYGLPVTARLLMELIERSVAASDSLIVDVATFNRAKDQAMAALKSVPAGSPIEFPVGATDELDKILKQVQRINVLDLRAQYHENARRVLDDLTVNLLKPWLRAVEDADGLLRREARPKNQKSVLDIWPGSTGVPDYLRPSAVEFLLDEVEEFPESFVDVIDRSVTGATQLAAVERAIGEVISGTNVGRVWNAEAKKKRQLVTEYDMPWSPIWEAARIPKQGPSTAQVVIRLKLSDLQSRARAWMWDDEKVMGHYVRETMSHYLTDQQVSGAELVDRESRLVAQFQELIRASFPLVALEPAMTQAIHNHTTPPCNLYMSPLNVPPQLRSRLQDVAQALLNAPQEIPITSAPRTDSMVLTLLTQPYHMVEIASIMRPVTEQWSRMAGTRDFWQWRRARPLTEWVPLSPAARRDLIRGWFAAKILGWTVTENDGKQLSLKQNGRAAPLARSTVREANSRDHVGMVVEGVAMAMMEAYRTKSLTSIEPYRTLIALGHRCIGEETENELTEWVSNGGKSVAPEFARLELDLSDAESRRTSALELAAVWEKSYLTDLHKMVDPDLAQRHATYEINSDILEALIDVKACLNRVAAVEYR